MSRRVDWEARRESIAAGAAARREMRQQKVDAGLRATDHGDYYAFARRMVAAFGRRVAKSDPPDLALLLALRDQCDEAIAVAVRSQRVTGFSWAEIAEPLGITKQAAQQRWGEADQ